MIRRAIEAGVSRPDAGLDVEIGAFWSPIYYRLLAPGALLDETSIEALAEIVPICS